MGTSPKPKPQQKATPKPKATRKNEEAYLKCATASCLDRAESVVRDRASGETIWLCARCSGKLGGRVERVGKASLASPFATDKTDKTDKTDEHATQAATKARTRYA